MSIKSSLIILGIVASVIITASVVNWWKDRQLVKETTLRVKAEEKIKQDAQVVASKTKELDSLKTGIKNKEELIDFLEHNPQIIIKNNDASHLSIDRLNAYNSILRFSDNVTKYDGNRNRYDLHRFDKNN